MRVWAGLGPWGQISDGLDVFVNMARTDTWPGDKGPKASHLIGLEPRFFVGGYVTKDRKWALDFTFGPQLNVLVAKSGMTGHRDYHCPYRVSANEPRFHYGWSLGASLTYRF